MRVPICIAVVAVTVLIPPGILVAQPTPLETAIQLEVQAKAAEQAGRLDEAFDLYTKAVRALPQRLDNMLVGIPEPTIATLQNRAALTVAVFEFDIRVRSSLVRLARDMTSLPESPDAERYAVRAKVLFDGAKNDNGFRNALLEFEKAVRASPWAVEYAFNLALAMEKLQYYKAAATNLKLYAESSAPDAADARRKSFEFEVRREDRPTALREDCDYFNTASSCLELGRQMLADWRLEKEEEDFEAGRVLRWGEGRLKLGQGCMSGSAQSCYEFGRLILTEWVWGEQIVFRAAKRLGERRELGKDTFRGLEFVQFACKESVAAACREAGAFFAKDWPPTPLKKNSKAAAEWYQRACDLDPVTNKADCDQARRLR